MHGPEIIKLLTTTSILLLVFALGAHATLADATSFIRRVFRRPYWLLRALVVMYVVVPPVAVWMGLAFDLARPVRVGLLAISIAPIPPILPGKQLKLGGSPAHVFGLLVAVSLSAIVQLPLMVGVIGWVFGKEASFGPWQVARLISVTILVPLMAGLMAQRLAPRWADLVAPWTSRLGTVLLFVVVAIVLVKTWPVMVSLMGGGALLAMIVTAATGIVAGHWLGGPDPSDRALLAVASAMRHPGIAIAVATANVPEEPRLVAAILLYVIVALVLTSLYGAAIRRRHMLAAGRAWRQAARLS
jgi:bile acid:Na+ symporter, BASS family